MDLCFINKFMNKTYILNGDKQMRCDFMYPVFIENKSLSIGSLLTMIPQGTKVSIWNYDTNSYYYQNPYHDNYFRAKVISWGTFEEYNVMNDLNNVSTTDAYLTINIDNFYLELDA